MKINYGHLPNKEQFLCLIDGDKKQIRLNVLKKLAKVHKYGENSREITRHQTLSELSGHAQVSNESKIT